MMEKKDACSSAGTPGQANEWNGKVTLENKYSTDPDFFIVYNLLPEGKEYAVSPKYLVNALGLGSTRMLRLQIERERKAGAVILCDLADGGYFRADTETEEGREDLRHYVAAMRMSAHTTLDSIAAAEKLLMELGED